MEGGESRASRKRKESDGADCKAPMKIPAIYDGDEDIDVDKFQIEEEMLIEAMKQLEEEIANPLRSCEPALHYQTNLQASSISLPAYSFVTINGNEESCGPSFSDSSSTVMASVDTGGLIGVSYSEKPAFDPTDEIGSWPLELTVEEEFWPLEEPAEVMEDGLLEKLAGGADESDDEWMARVLSWTACELKG